MLEVHLGDPPTEALLAGLRREYRLRYGGSRELLSTRPEEFDPPGGGFLVLVDGGETVAGGGIRRWSDGICEVKRMWTAPAHRRHGHALTVLRALEELARRRGYARIRLETGPLQPEAVALYERAGYGRIGVFGQYPQALAFERELATG